MYDLTVASVIERHKIASTAPQYVLLELVVDDEAGTVVRVNRSPEDVTWCGHTYTAFNFDMDLVEERGNGQLSTVQLRISNVNRMLQQYLEQYDGGVGCAVKLYSVNAVNLPDGPADVTLTFEIAAAEAGQEWVTFTLGADSPLRKAFPKFVYMKHNCRWQYNTPAMQAAHDPRGLGCRYEGALETCKQTWEDCQAHDNTSRFGGFPNIDAAGFRTANIL